MWGGGILAERLSPGAWPGCEACPHSSACWALAGSQGFVELTEAKERRDLQGTIPRTGVP